MVQSVKAFAAQFEGHAFAENVEALDHRKVQQFHEVATQAGVHLAHVAEGELDRQAECARVEPASQGWVIDFAVLAATEGLAGVTGCEHL